MPVPIGCVGSADAIVHREVGRSLGKPLEASTKSVSEISCVLPIASIACVPRCR